jgi:hypothetical protein
MYQQRQPFNLLLLHESGSVAPQELFKHYDYYTENVSAKHRDQ